MDRGAIPETTEKEAQTLRGIKEMRTSSETRIRRRPFMREVNAILAEQGHYKMQNSARDIIFHAADEFLVKLFEKSEAVKNVVTKPQMLDDDLRPKRPRVKLFPRDMHAVLATDPRHKKIFRNYLREKTEEENAREARLVKRNWRKRKESGLHHSFKKSD